MSALHLMSLPVNMREFRRCAALRGYSEDEGRALHHFLSETFGKGMTQPFRLMVSPGKREATLYAYTTLTGEILRQNAETAAPEIWNTLGVSHLAVKEMPDQWTEGRRLAFDVRARPVRRLIKPLEGRSAGPDTPLVTKFRKGAEVDAFLVTRLRQFPDGVTAAETGPTRESIYLDWLAERLVGAAQVDRERTRLFHFGRSKIARNEMREGPDAIFHGEFIITNGKALHMLLSRGLGRHTSYGYGMLLLRPVRR
jgi:CRISPR system Cascade subunit CasE